MEENQVAIYCRLSVEDIDKINDEDISESIQNQKLMLIDYALHQGWSIYQVYSDEDYSGLDRDRPGFNKMIDDARDGLFNIILCKNQSRFTRDNEILEKYLRREFIHWRIRFVSIIDNVDTKIKGTKKSSQIYGLINEWYCEDLSENIKAVFRKKMEDGQFLGPFAAFGYMKDPANHHKLIIDQEAAEIVRTVFRLYLQGFGCQQIANKLTADEVPTPTKYKQSKGINLKNPHCNKYSATYGIWSNNSINRMLKNEIYIGTLIQGREKKLSYKSKKVVLAPKDEWVILKNNHEPIIDINSFNTVQQLLHNRRQMHKPLNDCKGMPQAHLLAGKIKCMDCGANMLRSAPARNGEHYLRCALAYKTRSKNQACTPHTIKLEALILAISDKMRIIFNEYIMNDNELAFLQKHFFALEDLQKCIIKNEQDLKDLQIKSSEMSNAITQAYLDKSCGLLTESEFIIIKNTISSKVQLNMEAQLKIKNQICNMKNILNADKTPDELMKKHFSFEKLTHEMVNDFIELIQVGDKNDLGEQRIIVNWKF